jgi:radical SAM protein with 4Fe4S-binding SPASM domain
MQARKRLGSDTPQLEWQFLVNRFNEHEIETAKLVARDIDVSICFAPMEVWGKADWVAQIHATAARGEFDSDQWRFAPDSQRAVRSQFFEPRPWSDRANKWSVPLPTGVPDGCAQPFNRVSINWDGRVLPCCMCYGDNFYVGDLTSQSLEEIWAGIALTSSRKFLLEYGPKQDTGSVCETGSCALERKYVGEPDVDVDARNVRTVSFVPVRQVKSPRP